MRLFGSSDGPHMSHFHFVHRGDEVNGWWEVRNCEGLKWRVLRSGRRFAESAEIGADSSQTLVAEGDLTHFSDAGAGLGECFYTVFSQGDGRGWERQAAVRINVHEHLFWHHPDAEKAIMNEADLDLNPPATTWTPGSPIHQRGDEFVPLPMTVHQNQEGVAEWLQAER